VVDHQDFVNQIKALLPADWVNHTSRRKKKEEERKNCLLEPTNN
jgi:hypothetical protein